MTLRDNLSEHVKACFTALWVQSHEHDDALADIGRLCHDEEYGLLVWDCDRGLMAGQCGDGNTDPLAAIHALAAANCRNATLLVLPNFHRFLNNAEVIQALANAVTTGKQNRTFIVVLSPIVAIPPELEKLFVVLEHELPGRDQLDAVARSLATEPGDLPDDMRAVLEASAGLTRYEAEAAYSLSLVRHGRIEPSVIWELKAGMLKAGGALTLHRGTEDFDALCGLSHLKDFCRKSIVSRTEMARGVLLVSPPGCGKSQFCKSLGGATGIPVLRVNTDQMKSSGYGESEQRMGQVLRTADAMGRCILFFDEIEGLFAGASRQGDPGATLSMLKVFCEWLNDHTTPVYVVATSNDISMLPPEFSRAERFDAVFFLDFPTEVERESIWEMYQERFGLKSRTERPAGDGWSGAEVKACCRLAALLDVSLQEAALNVVPVSRTAADKITALRTWADGKCLDAARPGIYQRSDVASSSTSRRKLVRPSAN